MSYCVASGGKLLRVIVRRVVVICYGLLWGVVVICYELLCSRWW